MKKSFLATGMLLASTSIAAAGGVERSNQSVAILFEEGTYAELGFTFGDPSVSGISNPGANASGDMSPAFSSLSLSYRQDLTDQLSFAIILDEHIGAAADYPMMAGYPFAGSTAELDGQALTALIRYEFPSMVSVYGGVRVSQFTGDVSLPNLGPVGYTVNGDGGTELGYVLGVAYERPDIALRVSLTYNSAIDHTWNATESFGLPTAVQFDSTIPESWHFEAQTGIAPDTLLFGSVRWVDWTEFDIAPPAYVGVVGEPLVTFRGDRTTYTLGVGRRFNENWSGAISFLHEPEINRRTGNLAPVDGRNAVGLGVTWENDTFEVSGGVQYSWLGNAFTATGRASAGLFEDNTAIGAGLRFGYRF